VFHFDVLQEEAVYTCIFGELHFFFSILYGVSIFFAQPVCLFFHLYESGNSKRELFLGYFTDYFFVNNMGSTKTVVD